MTTNQAPRIPPPVVAALAFGVQLLLPAGAKRGGMARLAAVALGGAGVALSVSAARAFGKASTTIHPNHPEQATVLVTSGANALTRNPMYLGMCAGLVAHALWRRSPWALLPAAGAWLWLDRRQIPAEEHALQELFGPAYLDYRRRVPRWIGRPAADRRQG